MITDLLVIDFKLVEAKTGDVDPRFLDLFSGSERILELEHAAWHPSGVADPSAHPVALIQQPHFEECRF